MALTLKYGISGLDISVKPYHNRTREFQDFRKKVTDGRTT